MPTLTTRQQRAAAERKRNTWKVILALGGALVLHLLLLPIIVWVASHWPKAPIKGIARAPLQLTILPPTEATPAPAANSNAAPYMRTTEDQTADKKVEDPNFISDHDTLAASENPANGDKPLPSQNGRKSDSFEFADTNYRPGPTPSEAASAPPAPSAQKRTEEGKQNEAPAPTATPLPAKHRTPKKSEATPSPEGELAAAEPTASPEPPAPTPEKPEDVATNVPPQDKRQQSRSQPSNQSNPSLVPNPGLPKTPGYQPQTRQPIATGSINNRGKAAVQAIGTPMGRYIKNVQDSIGALWYYRVDEKMDVLSTGQVKLHFFVDRSGKARQVRVTSGSSTSALASVSTGAVMDADLPPIPPDLLETLPDGQMEMELGFDMY